MHKLAFNVDLRIPPHKASSGMKVITGFLGWYKWVASAVVLRWWRKGSRLVLLFRTCTPSDGLYVKFRTGRCQGNTTFKNGCPDARYTEGQAMSFEAQGGPVVMFRRTPVPWDQLKRVP